MYSFAESVDYIAVPVDFMELEPADFYLDCCPVKRCVRAGILTLKGVNIVFVTPEKLIAFCESVGYPVAGLLERLEAARYGIAKAA